MVSTLNPTADHLYSTAAIRLAEQGLATVTRNNPRVGCVIVKENKVIGRGFHAAVGQNHAEVEALNGCTHNPQSAVVYVNLEPCCTHGLTPPCTQALIEAQIGRVVVGSLDPNPAVAGKGMSMLQNSGIVADLLDFPEATEINCGYFKRMRFGRPYIRVKVAVSLDGRTAMADGSSQWITGSAAREDAMHLRARSGAIVTGIGTVLKDNPKITVRAPYNLDTQPLRVILDSQGRTPATAELLNHEGEVIIVCHRSARTTDKVTRWNHDGEQAQLDDVHVRLANEGVNEILVEAGPTLTGSYLASELWDELVIYTAPKILGSTALPLAHIEIRELGDAIGGRVKTLERLGDDVKIVMTKERPNDGPE